MRGDEGGIVGRGGNYLARIIVYNERRGIEQAEAFQLRADAVSSAMRSSSIEPTDMGRVP